MALPKVLATVAVMWTKMVGRAVVDAYAAAAAASAKNSISAHSNSKDALTRMTGMEVKEALKILNLDEKKSFPTLEEINQRYSTYFNANDPKEGGSFYLQSKVFRAKERLELEMKEKK